MEKHPIDDLFARRLHDHAQTPSAGAWNRLESRMGRKKTGRRAAWYWVAASVVLAAGCVALWRHQAAPETVLAVRRPAPPPPTAPAAPAHGPRAAATDTATPPAPARRPVPEPPARAVSPARIRAGQADAPAVPARQQPVQAPQGPPPALPADAVAGHPAAPAALNVTVVVVQVPDMAPPPDADAGRPEAAETAEAGRPRTKAVRLWQTLKRAKQSELNLDKDALFAWARDKGGRNEPR